MGFSTFPCKMHACDNIQIKKSKKVFWLRPIIQPKIVIFAKKMFFETSIVHDANTFTWVFMA